MRSPMIALISHSSAVRVPVSFGWTTKIPGAVLMVALSVVSGCGQPPSQSVSPSAECVDDRDCLAAQRCWRGSCERLASLTEEGQPCSKDLELVCGADAHSVRQCQGGALKTVMTCPSAQPCAAAARGNFMNCGDLPFTQKGTPCGREMSASCSFGRTTTNICISGVWEEAYRCSPTTCGIIQSAGSSTEPTIVGCANGGLTLGDRCFFPPGQVSCSTDLTQILGCSNGTAVLFRSCTPSKCTQTASGIDCL